MIKCWRKQATDPQKFKNCRRSFSHFLLVEAVDKIAASTSLILLVTIHKKAKGFSTLLNCTVIVYYTYYAITKIFFDKIIKTVILSTTLSAITSKLV